ncbi:MAG: two-component sensor histidine kinase, partial [Sphingomonas sp.]
MTRFLPKSLTGQIGLIVAVALFLAQAINFGLLLNERRNVRFSQIIVPAATRLAGAADRVVNPPTDAGPRQAQEGRRRGPPGYDPRTRVQLLPSPPEIPTEDRRPDIEQVILRELKEVGVDADQVVAVVRPVDDTPPRIRRVKPQRRESKRRVGAPHPW